jgi:hypothetical protein
VLDVLGDDAAVGAGPVHAPEVDSALAREAACEWRCLDPFPGSAGRRGRRRCCDRRDRRQRRALDRRNGGSGRSRFGLGRLDGLSGLADEAERRADGDLAFPDGDLQERPAHVRLDLLRHLLRVQLVEEVALLDRVPFGLQPFDDRPRLHPLAEPRQLDGARH